MACITMMLDSYQDAVYSSFGVHLNQNKREFVTSCKAMNIDFDTLNRVRNDLFAAGQVSGLVDNRALPVTRRSSVRKAD